MMNACRVGCIGDRVSSTREGGDLALGFTIDDIFLVGLYIFKYCDL
jgi:hypothetical protein